MAAARRHYWKARLRDLYILEWCSTRRLATIADMSSLALLTQQRALSHGANSSVSARSPLARQLTAIEIGALRGKVNKG
jgi:hypothetical protein